MIHALKWIKRHLVLSIVTGMVVGLFVGAFFDTRPLSSLVTAISFMMVYPMMVTLDFSSLMKKGNYKLQLVAQLINFVYLPLLAFGFGLLFFPGEVYLRLAILLIALLPTSGMTVSWTVMSKGNAPEAIRMIVIGLMLGGLLAPLYIGVLLGESIALPFNEIFSQILVIVFIPMLLGLLTQKVLKRKYGDERFKTSIRPLFPLASTFFVVLLITFVMSLRSEMLLSNPTTILRIIIPIIIGYVIMIASVHFIGTRLFSFENRVALVNGTVVRALSPALAIAVTAFDSIGPEVALVVALDFIVQVQLAAYYTRWNIARHEKAQT